MQTFLPYKNFRRSAEALDWQRLGKQRVECKQILQALEKETKWADHTATKMWKGYELALAFYMVRICDEWIARSYKDTCRSWLLYETKIGFDLRNKVEIIMPPWLGDERLHSSHRTALLVKDVDHYHRFPWKEKNPRPKCYNYFWPSHCVDYGGDGDGYLGETWP